MIITTADERREKARLRSERYRRRKGIPPRKPAARPWLAEGISRSTYYRRRKQARERAAMAERAGLFRLPRHELVPAPWLAALIVPRPCHDVFSRIDAQLADLRACLERAAEAQAIMAAVLGGHYRAGDDPGLFP